MLACVFFVGICLLFFTLYEQTYGSWLLFNDRMLTKDLFPSLVIREGHPVPWSVLSLLLCPIIVALSLRIRSQGIARVMLGTLTVAGIALIVRDCIVLPQSASSLTYLGPMFIVLLSPLMAWLWPFLERYGMNPSKPMKSAFGLAFAGLAFVPLLIGNHMAGPDALGSVWWLVLAYLLIEIGEVTLSPIGLAAVTQLSVPQACGLMMGAWWLGTSFSEQLASILGKLAALDIPADGKIDMALASAKYGELFQHMIWLGLASAVVALLLTPLIKRWMHGVK
jgi:POT family proton-dependent oligopeptide transporter